MTIEQAVEDQPISPSLDDASAYDDAWDNDNYGDTTEEKKEETSETPEKTDEKTPEEPKAEEKKDPEPKAEDNQDKADDKAEAKTDDKKDESKPAEAQSALERAEQRARDKFSNGKAPQSDDKQDESKPSETPDPEGETGQKQERKPLPAKERAKIEDAVAFTKERIGTLEAGARKEKLSELVTDYPEIADLAVFLAESLLPGEAPQPTGKLPDNVQQKLEAFDAMTERLETMEKNLEARQGRDDLRDYLDAIETEVPGSRKLVHSKEFQTWLDTQSVGVQSLADSGDPEDGVAVIQVYQESLAKEKARHHDEKSSAAAVKRTVGLRSSGGSSKSSEGKRGSSEDDYNAGYDLEAPERYR